MSRTSALALAAALAIPCALSGCSTEPPPAPAAQRTPTPTPTPDPREKEVQAALNAFQAYNSAYLAMERSGGAESEMKTLLASTTSSGAQRSRDLDGQRQSIEDPLRIEGESRLVYHRSDVVALEDPTAPTISLSTCWDGTGLKVEGSNPPKFLRKLPIMKKLEGRWLVDDMTTEVVDKCPAQA